MNRISLARFWSTVEMDLKEAGRSDEYLLFWLLMHPFQRQEDLALVLDVHQTTTGRILRQLEQKGLVEWILAPINAHAPRLYYLTQKALVQMAQLLGAVPEKLASMCHINERDLLRLLPQASSLVRLQEIVTSAVHEIPAWLDHERVPRSWRWQWRRFYQQTFWEKQRKQQLLVDAALVLSTEEEASALFVLSDPGFYGQQDLPFIRTRLQTLLRYREHPERLSSYAHFPPVWIVVPTLRQREAWIRCAREIVERSNLAPLWGAIAVWPHHQLSLSLWALSWRCLHTGTPCRLEERLRLMPHDAVPPGILAPEEAPPGPFVGEVVHARRPSIRGSFQQRSLQESARLELQSLRVPEHLGYLLQVLTAYPQISREELEAFVPWKRATMTRYLSHLQQMGYLQAGGTRYGQRLHLSEKGWNLVALRQGREKHVMEKATQVPSHLLRHQSGLYQFVGLLHRTFQRAGYRVLWWEHGARAEQPYRNQGKRQVIVPDARVACQCFDQRLDLWIEWDEGTMRNRLWSQKWLNYRHFFASRYGSQWAGSVPLVLVVVPESVQEQRVVRLFRRLMDIPLQVRVTTKEEIQERGILSRIWMTPEREERVFLIKETREDLSSSSRRRSL